MSTSLRLYLFTIEGSAGVGGGRSSIISALAEGKDTMMNAVSTAKMTLNANESTPSMVGPLPQGLARRAQGVMELIFLRSCLTLLAWLGLLLVGDLGALGTPRGVCLPHLRMALSITTLMLRRRLGLEAVLGVVPPDIPCKGE